MGFFTSAAKEQQKIEKILAQFPGPVTLHASRWKFIGFGLFFLPISIVGYSHVTADEADLNRLIYGFVGLIAGGMASAFFIYLAIFPRNNSLTLRRNSFGIVSVPEQPNWNMEWRHASNFTTMKYVPELEPLGLKRQCVAFHNDSGTGVATNPRLIPDLATIGCNAVLLPNYGLKAETFAELMNRWRERALQG